MGELIILEGWGLKLQDFPILYRLSACFNG